MDIVSTYLIVISTVLFHQPETALKPGTRYKKAAHNKTLEGAGWKEDFNNKCGIGEGNLEVKREKHMVKGGEAHE